MGLPELKVPAVPDNARVQLRLKLVFEELKEVIDALGKTREVEKIHFCVERADYWIEKVDLEGQPIDLRHLAKELADLLYVIYGFAHEYGIDLDAVFEEVHRSNMSKLGEDGKPVYAENGKVMKGPNYTPPDLEKIVPVVVTSQPVEPDAAISEMFGNDYEDQE